MMMMMMMIVGQNKPQRLWCGDVCCLQAQAGASDDIRSLKECLRASCSSVTDRSRCAKYWCASASSALHLRSGSKASILVSRCVVASPAACKAREHLCMGVSNPDTRKAWSTSLQTNGSKCMYTVQHGLMLWIHPSRDEATRIPWPKVPSGAAATFLCQTALPIMAPLANPGQSVSQVLKVADIM